MDEDLKSESGAYLLPSFFAPVELKSQIARALALQDRSVNSPTYGSFDRAYWYYRTLVGFPGATWQQLSFALACIALGAPPNEELRWSLIEAAKAGLVYWSRIQHADGSFDEWYRNERSYCPTAFTLGGMMETALLLRDHLDAQERRSVLLAGRRAGDWLAGRFNPAVANQNLAAVWGMLALAKATGEDRFRQGALKKLDLTLKQQSPEGWFAEYEGMDFGYSTLALDLIALASRHDQSPRLFDAGGRLSDFLWSVAAGSPCLPGKLGARGTGHVFPYGAFFFADRFPSAAALSQLWNSGFEAGLLTVPSEVDDRYFAYFYFPQFALAAVEAANPKPMAPLAPEPSSSTSLPESGLTILRGADSTLVISRHLGGAIAKMGRGRSPQYLLGYTLRLKDGTVAATNHWSPSSLHAPKEGSETSVRIATEFARQRLDQPLAKLEVPFTLFTHALANAWISGQAQRLIKAKLVRPQRPIDARLERSVTWDAAAVHVEDRIILGPIGEVWLRLAEEIAVHSPSSRLYGGDQGPPVRPDPMSSGLRVPDDQREIVVRYRIGLEPGSPIELASFQAVPGLRRQNGLHVGVDPHSDAAGSGRIGQRLRRP